MMAWERHSANLETECEFFGVFRAWQLGQV